MGVRLDFRILGPLEVYADGAPVVIAGARQRTVLATLLTSPGRVVSVETLAEAIWGSDPPATGRTQVAICVAGLRKTFRAAGCDDEVVVTTQPGYRLVRGEHRIDAHEFLQLAEQARQAAGQGRTEHAARLLGRALSLWRGSAVVDTRSDLLRAAGARLDEERLSAYEHYTTVRLELGEHRSLIGELTEMVRQQPLREQTRAHLMLAHYRAGRRAESLEVFQQGRRHITAELGLEPGPVLREMHRAILRDDPSLLRPVADNPGGDATGAPTPGDPTTGEAAAPDTTAGAAPGRTADRSGTDRDLAELDQLLGRWLEVRYRTLPSDAATMYRRLALVDQAGAGAVAGAALLDTCPDEAEKLLARLVDAQLLDPAGRDPRGRPRFRLSGLRRLYALARAQGDDTPAELSAARSRLSRAITT